MIAFDEGIQKSKGYILEGRLAEAGAVLQMLNPQEAFQKRWREHHLGIIEMREGRFEQAITYFANAITKHGNYISLILDLAACYAHTGQIYNWQLMVELAQYEFKNLEDRLDPQRKLQVVLLLTKFMEEKGELAESLQNYLQLSLECSLLKAKKNLSEYPKILAQIIRIQGQYQLAYECSREYQLLISHSQRDSSYDTDFEIQHALMIYEINEFGWGVAWARFKKLQCSPLGNSEEMNWVKSDLFFEFISRSVKSKADLQELHDDRGNLYGQCLNELLVNQDLDLQKYNQCVAEVSPASHLRLLKIWTQLSSNIFPQRKKIALLSQFSKHTQLVWTSYFKNAMSETQKLHLDLTNSTLTFNEAQVILSASAVEVLFLFKKRKQISVDQVLEKLWSASGSESDVSRLRMRISRLNSLLKNKLGTEKFFRLNKTTLSTDFELEIV